MDRRFLILIFLFPVFLINGLSAQIDSLIFINDNFIVGEIKDMDRGVVIIETDYSDSDFKIEWEGIKEIYTESSFLITLSDGRRFNGRLESTSDSTVNLLVEEGQNLEVDLQEVVFLKPVDDTFLSRLYATVDVGFSITKAKNLRQTNISANVGYLAQRWSTDAYYSFVTSRQEDVEPIVRGDGGLNFRYFLPKDWYLSASLNMFSSTEQKLDLRTTTKIGIGKYLIHTNQVYWGVGGGLNYNNENFSGDASDRRSLEGYFGTELNMYDIGDLSLLARALAYPSLTEKGRWRAEMGFDAKYDLPLDFYIRLGFNLNFDNQPTEGAGKSDYVLQTGVGWEW